ncbi:MAG: sulfotransferase [Acidobacteriota bacterium]
MTAEKVKVLYISGRGRSGSTILDNILSQVDGFFSAGELYYLRNRGLIEKRLCGCGEHVVDCEQWRKILADAYGSDTSVDEIVRLLRNYPDKYHIPYFLMPHRKEVVGTFFDNYLPQIERLYQGIQSATGCRVIVDSSKFPPYGYALELVPSIELYVIHLVRDSRAVAYSWLRKKRQLDKKDNSYLPQESPVYSASLWNLMNFLTEAFWRKVGKRYIFIRYEDFIKQPRETVAQILRTMGEERDELPFHGERQVQLGVSHTVSGNPSRFKSGLVELRDDNEWKNKMRPADRKVVTALTWPLLLKYGYGI